MTAHTSNVRYPSLDRVLPVTRVLAIIIIPFLFVAWLVLYLFPDSSGEHFAWPVRPHMTAMMLGAAYLGGVYYFARVARASQWHTVALGLPAVTSFATYLGIATVLHWDRFTPGHIAFILWAILYLGLPPILVGVWYWNRTVARAGAPVPKPDLSNSVRFAFGSIGVVLSVVSIVLMLSPATLIPSWPWTLTPLTARVMSALFVLPGVVGIGIARDGRWSSARILLQAQVGSLVLIVIAAILSNSDFDWSSVGAWLMVGSFVGLTAMLTILIFRFDRRRA
ncbi:MAG: hypothetical protein IPM16_03320 [Chloroflexi bacterium]|nr:hypothetical protein [Chloroflexota bacterium]